MNKTLAAERQKEILDLIQEQGSVKIADLVAEYNVSRETIRRDLNYMDKVGLVKKSHGGATILEASQTATEDSTPAPEVPKEIEELIPQNIQDPQKVAICKKAFEMIPASCTIFLDGGTTIAPLIKMIADKGGFTVVTSAITILNSLIKTNNTVIFVGGQINPVTLFSEGFQAINFLKQIRVEIAILGTDGFNQHNGPASKTYAIAEHKHTIIQNAQKTFVLTTNEKAFTTSLVEFATWDEIDALITAGEYPEALYQTISEHTNMIQVS